MNKYFKLLLTSIFLVVLAGCTQEQGENEKNLSANLDKLNAGLQNQNGETK